MDIEFHWTDESEDHISRHGVAPHEVEEARERPTFPRRSASSNERPSEMSERKRLEEIAEYYDTHDVSAEMEAAEWTRLDPVPADEQMIVVSVRLPKATMDAVRETAARTGLKPTALIRRWVEEQINETSSEQTVALAAVEQLIHKAVREELRDAGLRAS
jgi:hypothetical protein